MKTLKVTLKQHTPQIHFQHDQYGATLRASEVKPKLDRFILTKLGGGNYEVGKEVAKNNGWLIGNKNALNYKMSIVPYEKKEISLKEKEDNKEDKNVWVTETFPMILSNMGGKENKADLVNLSLYNHVVMTLIIWKDSLEKEMRDNIPVFFANTNFGQRHTKGFGSFTAYKFNDEEPIQWDEKNYYNEKCPYMAFAFEKERKEDSDEQPLTEKQKQEKLFAVLDFYWKCLKAGVNYTKGEIKGENANHYIKSFLYIFLNKFRNETWEKRTIKQTFHLGKERGKIVENPNQPIFARGFLGCPDKYADRSKEVKVEHGVPNDDEHKIKRIPAPIYFKPICFGNKCYIYLLFDISVTSSFISIPRDKRVFKFSNNGKSIELEMKPFIGSKNYMPFIDEFHEYLSENSDVLKALYTERSRDSYTDIDGEQLQDDVCGFVPKDFKWKDILKDENCVIFKNVEP